MKTFKFTYHYKGRSYSENIQASTKVLAVRNFFITTPNISKLTDLNIHRLC